MAPGNWKTRRRSIYPRKPPSKPLSKQQMPTVTIMVAARLLALGLSMFKVSASPPPKLVPSAFPELKAAQPVGSAAAFSFTNHTIVYAPVNNQVLGYPRVTELSDGSVLIACTLSGYYPAFFPIFKSIDGGVTWNWLSNVGVGGNSSLRVAVPKPLQARQGKKFTCNTATADMRRLRP
jgi:hypothetical protein